MNSNTWNDFFQIETKKEYYKKMNAFLDDAYSRVSVYPSRDNIFKCFSLTNPQTLKVVIIGQDPYHTKGVANGLAFSTFSHNKIPPSLINIFKELQSDTGIIRSNPDLTDWAKQGVLLLNTKLTVEEGKPNSHNDIGWKTFIKNFITYLNFNFQNLVFILWGNEARSIKSIITNNDFYFIESPHPSPFSAHSGFFKSKPFSKANDFLEKKLATKIIW